MRRRIAERLRFLADRIHPDSAFRMTHLRFYFHDGVGLVVDHEGHRGCPLRYRGLSDYELAHREGESPTRQCPANMDWRSQNH